MYGENFNDLRSPLGTLEQASLGFGIFRWLGMLQDFLSAGISRDNELQIRVQKRMVAEGRSFLLSTYVIPLCGGDSINHLIQQRNCRLKI